jgi:hypothetical protein
MCISLYYSSENVGATLTPSTGLAPLAKSQHRPLCGQDEQSGIYAIHRASVDEVARLPHWNRPERSKEAS